MAHRIAELIAAEASAGSGAERAEAKAQTQALILELWAMRAALPGRVDPTARLKGAIEVLEKLSSNEHYFFQHRNDGEGSEQEALKAHHNISWIIRNLALVRLANDIAEHNTDEANLPLSEEELRIRTLLDDAMASAVSRRIFVVSQNDQPPEKKSNVDLLREKIDASIVDAIAALNDLKESLATQASPNVVGHGRVKRRPTSSPRRSASRRKSI